jgi:hypothetical protein
MQKDTRIHLSSVKPDLEVYKLFVLRNIFIQKCALLTYIGLLLMLLNDVIFQILSRHGCTASHPSYLQKLVVWRFGAGQKVSETPRPHINK